MSISHLATKNGYQWATTSSSDGVTYLCATGVRIVSNLFQFPGIPASGVAGAAKARIIYEKIGRTVTISLQLYDDGNVPANVGQGVATVTKNGPGAIVIDAVANLGATLTNQLIHDIRCPDQTGALSRDNQKSFGGGLIGFINKSSISIVSILPNGNIGIHFQHDTAGNAPVVIPDGAEMCPTSLTFAALDDLILV